MVQSVSADEIIKLLGDLGNLETYHLIKFMRSNQGTCINQGPIVDRGQRVEKGEVIADVPAT